MSQALAPELRNLAGRQLGRYEVLTQLASGGMAAVYVARAKGVAGFERLVAVKVLHPHLAYEEEFISMFLDEARLAARIRHPNVVGTLDISDTEGDGFFLVMELVEGDHLGALLAAAARAGERVPTPVVARVVLDALHGLTAAHELTDEEGDRLELVHRDISPHNVMVGVDGIGRLTDFGVAKAEKRLTSTRAGHFKGKLAYMAPEQASTGHADQRSDLFAMGILLWESLTGRRLFRADNNAATLTKILQEPIPKVSELFPDLEPFDEVLVRALDRDPDARFQSAEEMAEALERVARTHGGVASARAVGAEVRRWLAEKLETQRSRIREAMTQLGHADVTETALPVPRDGSLSSVSRSGPRALGRDAATSTGSIREASGPTDSAVLGTLASPSLERPTHSKTRAIVLAVAVALVGGGVAAAAILMAKTSEASPASVGAPSVAAPSESAPSAAAPSVGASETAGSPATTTTTPPTSGVEPSNVAADGVGTEAEPEVPEVPQEVADEASAERSAEARSTRRSRREARAERAASETTTAPTPMEEAVRAEPARPEAEEPRVDPPRMDPPRMSPPPQEPIFNPYRQ